MIPPPRLLSNLGYLKAIAFTMLIAVASFLPGCKKTEFFANTGNPGVAEKFFSVPANASPVIRQAIEKMKQQNERQPFVEAFVKNNGYINWEHATVSIRPQANTLMATTDTIIETAVVPDQKQYVSDLFYIKLDGEMMYKLMSVSSYEEFPFMVLAQPTISDGTAEHFFATIAKYQKQIFNTGFYKILDTALFKNVNIEPGPIVINVTLYPIEPEIGPPYYLQLQFMDLSSGSMQTSGTLQTTLTDAGEIPEGGGAGWVYTVPIQSNGENGNGPFGCLGEKGWEPLEKGDDGFYRSGCGSEEILLYEVVSDPNGPTYQDISQAEPPVDLKSLLNCFIQIPDEGATYSVKLCVDIPVNGIWNSSINFSLSPGHTFLTLTKTNGIQSISQSVGFYPIGSGGNPWNPNATGAFKNNGDPVHEYNAAVTATNLNSTQFYQVINNLLDHENDTYNIFDNNCTTRALEAFNIIVTPPINVEVFNVYFPHTPAAPYPIDFNFSESPQKLYKAIGGLNAGANISKEFNVVNNSPISTANNCP